MSPLPQLDQGLSDRLQEGMSIEGGIALPFTAPIFWALNGQANFKSQLSNKEYSGAQYYGGWAANADDLEAALEELTLPIPAGLKKEVFITRDAQEVEIYSTRFLAISPISYRKCWLFDNTRYNDFVKGGRQHVQLLAMLGVREKGDVPFDPWGPIVITAKGFQAQNLLDSITAWKTYVTKALRAIGSKLPPTTFYAALGTFGKDRVSKAVGQQGAQSNITPITAYMPEKLNEDQLVNLFVGEDTAAAMVEYLEQAKDWLEAWNTASVDNFGENKTRNGNAATPPQPDSFPDEPPF